MAAKKNEDVLSIEDKLRAALVPKDEQPYPIPGNWVWTRIGDITKIVGGGTPRSNDQAFYKDGTIPWIRPVDLSDYDDIYISRGSKNITEEGLKNSSARLIHKNSLLFSSRAPIGYVAIAANDVTTSQGFKSFLPTSALVPQFGYWYLKYAKPLAESLASGTTFQEISGSKAALIPIPLPPLPEQKRIAEKLESLLGKIKEAKALLDEIPEIFQNFRQTVLAAACSGRLTEDWRKKNHDVERAAKLIPRILGERRRKWEDAELAKLRNKGTVPRDDKWKKRYKDAESVKEEETYALPDTWVWSNLDQLSWSVKDGPHYSPNYVDAGIPFISGGNIRTDGIDFSTAKYITPELHEQLSERCNPKYGDLLYTKGGTTGIARINTETREFSVWVHVAVLKLVDSMDRFYLQHTLNSPHCYAQSQKYTHGVGNQDLGLTRMIWITVPLPPLEEQKEISRRVDFLLSNANDLEVQYKDAMELIESLPGIILSKAFRGELVSQDPNDEPASVLLRRIVEQREVQKPLEISVTEAKMIEEKVDIKKRVPVLDVIREASNWISAPELLLKAGFPNDADPDAIEDFYLQLKSELKATPPRIERERHGDNDYFRAL